MADRGLQIHDLEAAKQHVERIGYYRLCGYALPFQLGGDGIDRHQFQPGSSFEQMLDRYIFDRKLRLLLLDAIERIEVAVRASLSNGIAQRHSPHWYLNPALFQPGFDHARLITEIRRQIGHNASTPEQLGRQDIFIKHYYDTYNAPEMPPSWMVFESITFGAVSRIFEGLYKSETTAVCLPFKINHDTLSSWLHAISYVRNLCAHHSRVWNKILTLKPAIAKKHKEKFAGNTKIYSILVVCQIILERIAPDNTWADRLADLCDQHPGVPINSMGFPVDWRDKPFWQLVQVAV